METLVNGKFFQYSLNRDLTWNVTGSGGAFPAVTGAQLEVTYRKGWRRYTWRPSTVAASLPIKEKPSWGPGPMREFSFTPDEQGLETKLQVGLSDTSPLICWRLRIRNTGAKPLQIDRLTMLGGGPGRLLLNPNQKHVHMYVNGWQSWSFAGGLSASDSMPGVKLGSVSAPMHDNGGRAMPWGRGNFISDMFAYFSDHETHTAAALGFLSQREQFGTIHAKLDSAGPLQVTCYADADGVLLDPGAELETDWACLVMGESDAPLLERYLQTAARESGARVPDRAPFGWCSWYQYYDRVTEEDLRANMEAARKMKAELPIDVLQLDDGYQAEVGDWEESNEKFPTPMRELASEIRKRGFQPGLWMAPFLVKPAAQIAKQHPEWLLRGKRGGFANAGYIWFKWTRTLDVSQPEVVEHLRGLIRMAVKKWGFRYLKLDFLYGPAVAGRMHDPRLTRAQALRKALEAIREAAGKDTFLVGCGCPLGSGIGIFDAMRIGPDVDRRWEPRVLGRRWIARDDPTVPSAANAVRNALTRAPLHGVWWWNDPDCLLARDSDTFLTEEERRTMANAIAITGGSLLVSDDLSKTGPEYARQIQPLLPSIPGSAHVLDLDVDNPPEIVMRTLKGAAGQWNLLAIFNWEDKSGEWEVHLPECHLPEDSHVFSFWDGKPVRVIGGRITVMIPPHGSLLLGVYPIREGVPALIGTTLHVSQGLEITSWKAQKRSVVMTVETGHHAEGKIFLSLPKAPLSAKWNREAISAEHMGMGRFAFNVEVEKGKGKGTLSVNW